ncbi:hypothetical protein pqer_cds_943 [Pandoravirus quercus]|uniref:Uncharacterized protein n=1 Tax=Pandoravirus quercus TaxID=2107709 RepID=A0A2U7UAF6_9VIRU|nr:hypothetical protein pqer_cds_943 [Pandoravirus quercus]AVK75365.1 hypothetical protein pqer_cds_943 [Pandoravirus quercus]
MADGGVIRSTTVSRQERHQPNLGDTASGDEQERADTAGVTFADEDDVTRELWSEGDHFEGVIDKGRPIDLDVLTRQLGPEEEGSKYEYWELPSGEFIRTRLVNEN